MTGQWDTGVPLGVDLEEEEEVVVVELGRLQVLEGHEEDRSFVESEALVVLKRNVYGDETTLLRHNQ
eukprot:CAMPEP_0184643238 /NCGR_PEP_ID=MMETSP0308-20130426/42_1 /TAXON_ID=38269 /ORGANISM="Gloeochaete witrockiana, Strain SAG 46.84" /LENGTH=66 /DNA_ID=CAMNT_0027071017 /DNA_START=160 /DNA_END=360 /DNA_ORIENTATION=+